MNLHEIPMSLFFIQTLDAFFSLSLSHVPWDLSSGINTFYECFLFGIIHSDALISYFYKRRTDERRTWTKKCRCCCCFNHIITQTNARRWYGFGYLLNLELTSLRILSVVKITTNQTHKRQIKYYTRSDGTTIMTKIKGNNNNRKN